VNLDLAYVAWSAYVSPTAKTKAHLDAKPPPGTPVDLPDDPKPTRIEPLAFEDRVVPRLGVEYLAFAMGEPRAVRGRDEPRPAIEIPVRAGYALEISPVPDQTGVTNFVDADRHTLSLGAGIAVNAPHAILPGTLALDVHVLWSILPERSTLKASAADFVGDYRAGGSMLGGGATLSAVF
jgi:long-chain fatty acid transport protein